MMLMVVNDVHFSLTPPRWRTETYGRDILDKFDFVRDLCKEKQVEKMVIAGDLFHRAAEPVYGISLLAEVLRSLEVEILLLPGNHDVEAGRTDSYMRRPVGPLIKSGLVKILGEDPVCVENASITGCPFSYSNLEYGRKGKPGVGFHVRISHGMIMLPGYSLPKQVEWVRADNMDLGGVDVLFNGHIHNYQGIWTSPDNVHRVVCVGALSRGSMAEHDIKRTPMVCLFDTLTGIVTTHMVPVKEAEKVYRMREASAAKAQNEEVAAFVNKLETINFDATTEYGWLLEMADEVPNQYRNLVKQEIKNQMRAVGVEIG